MDALIVLMRKLVCLHRPQGIYQENLEISVIGHYDAQLWAFHLLQLNIMPLNKKKMSLSLKKKI